MKSVDFKTIRILHIVGGMSRGGIETWLMHVLRHIDRDRFKMDFVVHTEKSCPYDDEVRSLGSKIIPCLDPSKPLLYGRNFKRILHEYGPYDIVHSHVHHYSGYILRLAEEASVPIRIAHCHNDSSSVEANANWQRRFYLNLMKGAIKRHATLGLGCSQAATIDLFGSDWKNDPRWQLLHCSIDLLPFREPVDSVELRAELGIPASAFVIGHVGRFHEQKNHQFLLEIFAEIAKREPQAYLLLLGEGSLRPNIEQQALRMGLSLRIIFAGTRSDIPRLMVGAMDVFFLPSLYEGLGLVLVEAQAAGLPCIFSDVVPEEADLVKPLVRRISLSKSASVWADEVFVALDNISALNKVDALAIVEESSFNVRIGVKSLVKVYESNM
jgi:glycosyltransferase involved in cell wall biosynthesis